MEKITIIRGLKAIRLNRLDKMPTTDPEEIKRIENVKNIIDSYTFAGCETTPHSESENFLTKEDEITITVSGNTFPIKENLKNEGFSFDNLNKEWEKIIKF